MLGVWKGNRGGEKKIYATNKNRSKLEKKNGNFPEGEAFSASWVKEMDASGTGLIGATGHVTGDQVTTQNGKEGKTRDHKYFHKGNFCQWKKGGDCM